MIDPLNLAVITSAVSVLGVEYAKGIATEAGKSSWEKIKQLFGWVEDPHPAEIPQRAAAALVDSPELAKSILGLLKRDTGSGGTAAMVGHITAEKVINVQTMHGNINM
jgi:hypothetical protein